MRLVVVAFSGALLAVTAAGLLILVTTPVDVSVKILAVILLFVSAVFAILAAVVTLKSIRRERRSRATSLRNLERRLSAIGSRLQVVEARVARADAIITILASRVDFGAPRDESLMDKQI